MPVLPKSKNFQNILKTVNPNYLIKSSSLPISEVPDTIILNIEELLLSSSNSDSTFSPISPADPSQTAYIITTSGTTGNPKLIPISYSNFTSYIKNLTNDIQLGEPIRLIQNFEISFDPYLFDLVITILSKGRLFDLGHADIRNFKSISRLLTDSTAWISLTPTQADLLVSLNPDLLYPFVAKSFFLGEKLKRTLCEKWLQIFPNTRIYNLYGPAETTVSISFHEYDRNLDTQDFVPVGSLHRDHFFRINSNAELLIKGPQVFGGYLLDPASSDWFNTHDIVKLENSNLYILGRSDLQIKINGRRLELEEIESVLHSNQVDGYVVPHMVQNEMKEKINLVFVTRDRSVLISKLHDLLTKHFDLDHIPKTVLFVEEYPLSQNGKIDRAALSGLLM